MTMIIIIIIIIIMREPLSSSSVARPTWILFAHGFQSTLESSPPPMALSKV